MTTAMTTRQEQPGALQAAYGAFSPAVLREQIQLIQQAMSEAMVEGHHYGTIPGCGDKPTLLKPGAEKLAFLFRLALEIEEEVVELGGGHREYRLKCRLKSMTSGQYVGEGVGSCSTMESKYRWRKGERVCPACGATAIIKGKEEYGGGWMCWKKKGGCGAKFSDGAKEIESQQTGRVENTDIADTWNTCLKIAKKRASVDAVLTATAASDIFAQDLEDLHDVPEELKPVSRPAPKSSGGQHSSPSADAPKTTPKTGQELYSRLDARDKELAAAGVIQRGDLLRHIASHGATMQFPKSIHDWKMPHILVAVESAKAWINELSSRDAGNEDSQGDACEENQAAMAAAQEE